MKARNIITAILILAALAILASASVTCMLPANDLKISMWNSSKNQMEVSCKFCFVNHKSEKSSATSRKTGIKALLILKFPAKSELPLT